MCEVFRLRLYGHGRFQAQMAVFDQMQESSQKVYKFPPVFVVWKFEKLT